MNTFSKLLLVSGFLAIPAAALASDVTPGEIEKLRAAGTIKSFDVLDGIATGLHAGSTVKDADLDLEKGRYVYQVELRDAQGVEHEIDIDASTGEVLTNRVDND
ncbi:conserved hypothetical protein [gamma proteobacterium HdN1]|nr:conserved hypothetical protein [gamma proteobacterium HdN1]